MATSKEYKDFVLEQLGTLDNIICKPMMGEFLLYYNNILFGGIYDNRLLVKIVETNKKYNMEEQLPYDGAKLMYLVEDVDMEDKQILLDNIDKIHTTKMGIDRIKKNLDLSEINVVEYCKKKVLDKKTRIYKQGKNWYCEIGDIKITINSYSYTIITAHKK